MKARDAALRLKRFELDAKVRKVEDLEQMIREFEGMAIDLDRQIQVEEERTGIRDRNHFPYSTFARSALQRRDNLSASIGDLRDKLAAAVAERNAASSDFEDADAILQATERRSRPSGKPTSLSQN